MKLSVVISLLVITGFPLAKAHGDHTDYELLKRNHFISQRSLASCQNNLEARGLFKRSVDRRADLLRDMQKRKNLPERSTYDLHLHKRDITSASAISHHSNLSVTYDENYKTLFAGNTSCLLTPEVTDGPYYVSGEYIRKDIRESQKGVELYLDIQVIDVNTCKPVSDAYFDAWHANATGVYSGIVASGNGDDTDGTNLNSTFLRGLQPTNSDGVVQFITLFPGHYSGRATHLHILAHRGGSILSNSTYSGGNITHVGQLFFDESLRTDVEKVAPYSTNTAAVTLNKDDQWATLEATNDYDPFVEYAYLGDSVSDGLLAWITVGIDVSEAYDDAYTGIAAYLTDHGGVVNGGSGIGGSAGGGPGASAPSGNMSGGPPSGSMSGGGAGGSGMPTGTDGGSQSSGFVSTTSTKTSSSTSSAVPTSIKTTSVIATSKSSSSSPVTTLKKTTTSSSSSTSTKRTTTTTSIKSTVTSTLSKTSTSKKSSTSSPTFIKKSTSTSTSKTTSSSHKASTTSTKQARKSKSHQHHTAHQQQPAYYGAHY